MVTAYLTALLDLGINQRVPENVAQTVFEDVLSDLVENFGVQFLGGIKKPEPNKRIALGGRMSRFQTAAAEYSSNPGLGSQNLAKILCQYLSLGQESEVDQIVSKLNAQTETVEAECFHSFYLPFLKHLIDMLSEEQLSAHFQSLF